MRRREAALAGHSGDAPLARELLSDVEPSVRATALGALMRIGALRSSELMTASLDSDTLVRRRAAELLATWQPVSADQEDAPVSLGALLHDEDASVVEVAAWATGERLSASSKRDEPMPEPELVDVLCAIAVDHDDALCREAAVASLGAIGAADDTRGLEAILSACNDKPAVRRRAVIALAAFDGPEVQAALERALGDHDWQVRQAAEDLLRDD